MNMVEQLKILIEHVVSQEVSKTSIGSNLTSQVAQETGNSLLSGLSGAFQQGNITEIMGLFNDDKSNLASNPLVKQIVTGLATNLGSKFGIDEKQASGFATSIIPMVISFIGSKAKSGDAGFSVTDLISGLSGGNSGSLLDSLAGFGLDKNGDGIVDFKDAIAALSGDDKKGNKGGLGGLLGGLFGK